MDTKFDINSDINALNTLKNDFLTENSKDISDEDILYAYGNVDRGRAVIELNTVLTDIEKSIKLEMGIFEFALVNCMLNSIDKKIIPAVYRDRLEDVILNLDKSSYLKNNTLSTSILSGKVNPRLVAFMAPDQMHPENWALILQKVAFRIKTESNIVTSDLYQCEECHERKMRVTELQMRGLDEPTTVFLTCMKCYKQIIL